jgi:hypothetical protein
MTEREKVESWRMKVLMDAGADPASAAQLAASDVDLHRAVVMLSQGCSAELAVRILT